MSTELTAETFRSAILNSAKPVLVDFWATWCPPCRVQSPILDHVAEDLGENAIVAKVNIDEEPSLAQSFHVHSIPTLLVFKDGKIAKRYTGVTTRTELTRALKALASSPSATTPAK